MTVITKSLHHLSTDKTLVLSTDPSYWYQSPESIPLSRCELLAITLLDIVTREKQIMKTSNTLTTTTPSLDVSSISVRPSFTSPSTPKLKESTSSKYDYMYEITHIPEGNQVEDSHLPLLNPYKAFRRSSSFSSSVKKLVSPKFQVHQNKIKLFHLGKYIILNRHFARKE